MLRGRKRKKMQDLLKLKKMLRVHALRLHRLLLNRRKSASSERKLSVLDLQKPKNRKKMREELRWRKKLNRKLRESLMKSFKWKSKLRKKRLKKH